MLVVSVQEGPAWPGPGNSFWLSHQQGAWLLSTWSPVCYRLPYAADIVALCSACMNLSGPAMYRVPTDIVRQFGLQELTEQEFLQLFPE